MKKKKMKKILFPFLAFSWVQSRILNWVICALFNFSIMHVTFFLGGIINVMQLMLVYDA